MIDSYKRIIFALDVPSSEKGVELAKKLSGSVGYLKIGLELFVKCGPQIISEISNYAPIFLDLKLHDIPATIKGAIQSLPKENVQMLTIHASNSKEALMEAVKSSNGIKIIAVTVLTSISQNDLEEEGYKKSLAELAVARAVKAKNCGCHGVVCSVFEAKEIRKECGNDFLIITPGIRPSWEGVSKHDQKRVATPAEAIKAGADFVVIGRAIRDADDPQKAAMMIAKEIDFH